MAFVLRRDTVVGEPTGGRFKTLTAGTKLSELDEYDRDQLAPEHFRDDGGSDELPPDWRTNEDTLEADARQAELQAAEAEERAAARAARYAEQEA